MGNLEDEIKEMILTFEEKRSSLSSFLVLLEKKINSSKNSSTVIKECVSKIRHLLFVRKFDQDTQQDIKRANDAWVRLGGTRME